ncbi:MAG: 4-oxalomesaconate tautomerase [Acidimicrobiia bacterium]|nr:4-oxalomesaconate tautomerase [Acidimicrobiia bacterium]
MTERQSEQHAADGVRCMLMRGGSSKGAYFLRDELPTGADERDLFLMRIMGTPDPRQIDGIGGAHPLTSKVAVVAPSEHPRAHIEYLFLQVGVDQPTVTDRQNCGNLLAGVAPFAIERGLLSPRGEHTSVRIHMLNTDSVATATLPLVDGMPVYAGPTAISGVPGTAAPIRLDFEDIAGGSCGALLPTGNVVDKVAGVACTLVDNGMPVVVMRATEVGVAGYEDCAELEANVELRAHLEDIRLQAGKLMRLGDVTDTTVPKLTIVAPPRNGGAISTRTFIPHRCHDAIGVLGAVSVATAALLPGSPANDVLGSAGDRSVVLEHPTGTFEAAIDIRTDPDGRPIVERAGIIRTARKLMDGLVFARAD